VAEDPDSDLVKIRSSSGEGDDATGSRADPWAAPPQPAQTPVSAVGSDFEITLQSAALLNGEHRIPIPREGLTIGSGEAATIRVVGVSAVQAAVAPTEDGHVVVERGERAATYTNGELLVAGERRALRRGDAIAVGGANLYYLPRGQGLPRLARVKPVDAGRLRATKRGFAIGRDPECDLVLDHPTISLHHAVLSSDGTATTITDLGSAVGVRVNGVPVRRTRLEIGDQIAIGPYRIVFDGLELFERAVSVGLAIAASAVRVDVESGTILQPTDLQLRAGELIAIIGESGAGKSTLLNALAGVSVPTGGQVLVGGEPVQIRQSEIGYVPQFDIVHDELTVTEALDFAARLRLPQDTAEHERCERVCEVIAELGLTDRADIRVSRLSGGQRKRVAVGVELLHRPGALFLDEPTTGLDPGLEHHMTKLFRQLANSGQTVALVTHATGSMHLYDRVIVMGRGGYLRFDGKPGELREAFGVEHYDDVYSALERVSPTETTMAATSALPALPPIRRDVPATTLRVRQSLGYQTRVLANRYALLVLRDRKYMRSALIQVPVLGIFTAILFSSTIFATPPHANFAGKSAQLVFLMVTIAIWLGAINAAREIVKERNVLDRELAVGVRLPAYLASKLVVLLSFAAVQIVLFALIVLVLRPLHAPSSTVLDFLLVLVLVGSIAALLGLLVSAVSTSEDQATAIIPLLLVPQLLFGGAIVQHKDMTSIVRFLSVLVPSRWGFAAAGHAVHMQRRIDEDHVFSRISHYGPSFFSITLIEFAFICAIFAAVISFGIVRLLAKPAQ
jgi:ABC-type multidrug transport system ATPase subunit/pSer/pThr/pTyr-binding forkhead associated (FHA) protein/ABC-type multidrug transport system permease subunit